jgi:small subunit ribosomal protein S3e
VLRFIMENNAKGCEIIVSGKLRAQRAKAMKFRQGYMIKSGNSVRDYIDSAVRHVMLRQGVLGIKVQIMLPQDPLGKTGPKKSLADVVTILEPKDDSTPNVPRSAYSKDEAPASTAATAQTAQA